MEKNILIIGAGAWGTALANLCAHKGHQTQIWAYESDCAEAINAHHENKDFLPNIALHPDLRAISDDPDFAHFDIVLLVCPAQHMRAILTRFSGSMPHDLPLILCSKGIEHGSLAFMTQVAQDCAPQTQHYVLSGPSFAKDVALGLPTAVTLAGPDHQSAGALAHNLGHQNFRLYSSNDPLGAEIGGAVKNVLAIGCGIVLGLGLGQSAHAALIARGFAEMRRLGTVLGARPETLSGLCGLGDLVLTCSSEQSRNMSCGMALGQGQTIAQILGKKRAVTEGVATAPALMALADKYQVDMPICRAVAQIIAGEIRVDAAVDLLLSRPLKQEYL